MTTEGERKPQTPVQNYTVPRNIVHKVLSHGWAGTSRNQSQPGGTSRNYRSGIFFIFFGRCTAFIVAQRLGGSQSEPVGTSRIGFHRFSAGWREPVGTNSAAGQEPLGTSRNQSEPAALGFTGFQRLGGSQSEPIVTRRSHSEQAAPAFIVLQRLGGNQSKPVGNSRNHSEPVGTSRIGLPFSGQAGTSRNQS